ncbi:hypothetical protein BJ170DRAFT_715140 [Xylariales sp. AK1849]|nr:hypothetical protein BJ170DRAFT_715140 [Xylariales sp. AK1849]
MNLSQIELDRALQSRRCHRQGTAKIEAAHVSSEKLQDLINIEDLLAGSQKLQDIADANDGNRAFGSTGHNATVDYLYDTLSALDYYDVIKQPLVQLLFGGNTSLLVGDVDYEASVMTYSPSGIASAPLVLVSNVGCNVTDFPAEVEGNIALISRGTCSFAQKSTNAKATGTAGAVVYNNVEGSLGGTLGTPDCDYAPIVRISQEDGNTLLQTLEAGEVVVNLAVDTVTENRTTLNVAAEAREGDKDNVLMLGGYTDSVPAGPGINGDGSGTIGSLVVAVALSKFSIQDSVRFGFWSAEEVGKLGSLYYMEQLNTSETEVAKIRAYVNFDVIANPNYVHRIYDGDGTEIEKTFEDYFKDKNTSFVASEFTGRSDYQAFIENGIPSGGIFTGAENEKTAEEVTLFGGEAGVAYDVNYHSAGDTIDNLALDAYVLNTQGIADAVAKYATSFESLPPVDLIKRRRAADRAKLSKRLLPNHAHGHAGPCGQNAQAL